MIQEFQTQTYSFKMKDQKKSRLKEEIGSKIRVRRDHVQKTTNSSSVMMIDQIPTISCLYQNRTITYYTIYS